MMSADNDTFVAAARGTLKVFKPTRHFGLISPVSRPEPCEGPALQFEEIWFFSNGSLLLPDTIPGVTVSFEIWENSEKKRYARAVKLDNSIAPLSIETRLVFPHNGKATAMEVFRRHPNEPSRIYPSVYISDVPVEFSEDVLKELHTKVGLNPEMIVGLKFLPSTANPHTRSCIARYGSDDAAEAAVDRLKGHPVRLSNGTVKYLGAKHAAPASWMVDRISGKPAETIKHITNNDARPPPSAKLPPSEVKPPPLPNTQAPWPPVDEIYIQPISGRVLRVSAAGYGVIQNDQWGEVMWRQYELPKNLRSMQFVDAHRFQVEVQLRPDYHFLKEMEGREVDAELYRMPNGELVAREVKCPSLNTGTGSFAQGGLSCLQRIDGCSSHEIVPPPSQLDQSTGADLRTQRETYHADGYSRSHAAHAQGSSDPVNGWGVSGVPNPSSPGQMGQWCAAATVWGPQNPFYKTQPCPHLMNGMCQMGQGCYFAHSPNELRPVPPEASQMNPFLMMAQTEKDKKKREKKDKKDKRKKERDRDASSNSDRSPHKKARSFRMGGNDI